MQTPKQITAWQTSDGRVFKSEEEAGDAQLILTIKEWCERKMYNGIDAEDVASILCENAADLVAIFRAYGVNGD